MPSSTNKLEGEPIIIHTLQGDYNVADEATEGVARLNTLLDSQPEPVSLIIDLTQVRFGLDDIVSGANLAARAKGGSALFRHPCVKERIIVSGSDVIKLAAKGLDSDVFGHVALKVFGTLDEALAYCRQKPGD